MPIATNRLEELQVKKLIQCVREGDSSQIEKMIELGLPDIVNLQEPDRGFTALHVAVTLNIDNLVTLLLNRGSSTVVQDLQGCTPVMRACEHGHIQTLEALTANGLSLNIADVNGKTAPFYCLYSTGRHVKCFSLLLQFGADPNTKTTDGIPLLYAICETGHDKLLDILLRGGADPNAREPKMGKPAIVIAIEGGYKECVQLLAEAKADLNAIYGDNGLCAVHRCASLGHFEILQILSAYGVDFTTSTIKTSENSAHFATLAYKLLCIRFLGQRGCSTNEVNQEGNTPQKIAKNEGIKDAMKELKKLTTFQDKVSKGGKPKGYAEPWSIRLFDWLQCNKQSVYYSLKDSTTSNDGVIQCEVFKDILTQYNVPLTEEDWEKLLKIYDKKGEGKISWDDLLTDHKYVHANYKLKANDDIKAKKKKGKKKKGGKGKKGKTKIHFPIYFEATNPPMAGVSDGVIEKQIFVTDEQRFPRDTVPPHSYTDDSLWYLIPPDHRYIQIYEAVRHGDITSLLTAFSHGVEIDSRDKYNKTCLMIACGHGRIDIVKLLIEKGGDINAIDNFMWTPLHHACHSGQEDIVRLLLEQGANIDSQSYNGGTPLMRAIETSHREIVKLLISQGAKLTLANKHGETALEVARNWGDEIVYAIVYAKAATLPALPVAKGNDKKGGGKKGGGKKGGGKKGKKESKGTEGPLTLPGPPLLPPPLSPRLSLPLENLQETRKKASFQSLQSDVTVKPLPSYHPKPAWVSRPLSTKMFQDEQTVSRTERGTESVDFGESKTTFQLQIIARAQALEISDE